MRIWQHLSYRRRLQLIFLLVCMVVNAGLELLTIGATIPFLSLLGDPDRIWNHQLTQEVSQWLGFTSANQLLVPATVVFMLVAIFAALIRLATLWLGDQLAALVGSDLSCEAYLRTLYQPYGIHLQRNSASVIVGITQQVDATMVALTALMQLITALFVSCALFIGMLLIDWVIAIIAISLFTAAYFIITILTREELQANSEAIQLATSTQLQKLQEGMGAIRDVLLDGSQMIYVDMYRREDRPQRRLWAKNKFLAASPRYILEVLGLLVIAFCGLQASTLNANSNVLPVLGGLALGAQRLLPALQQAYSGWAVLKASDSQMSEVLKLLSQKVYIRDSAVQALRLQDSICLENIHYRYAPDLQEVLCGLNCQIRRGERIGLVGVTGSGKSTTVDLLMGLLVPTSGRIIVDGLDLHDPAYPGRLASWMAAIAHVPQNIYLADCSIAQNIAFGIPNHQIDMHRVKQAAKQAQIYSFIEGSPDGFNTFVGERGIRLSGGQRQRIGIARAIYKQSKILVLDEATSALDVYTESQVMESIKALNRNITVIIISHNLTTLAHCNRVIQLKGGVIQRIIPASDLDSISSS